jgi:hypothetical protein
MWCSSQYQRFEKKPSIEIYRVYTHLDWPMQMAIYPVPEFSRECAADIIADVSAS